MGKISVIIPTHNRADLLPRAVRSVQNQTRAVDEIIIVSDGSTDNTEETVKALAEQDERIHLIAYHPEETVIMPEIEELKPLQESLSLFWMTMMNGCPEDGTTNGAFEKDPEVGLVYSSQNCIYLDTGITYQTQPMWRGDLSRGIYPWRNGDTFPGYGQKKSS